MSTRPHIQAFVFNWKGHEEKAAALESRLSKLVNVSVINSDPMVSSRHPHWIHLDESAYFAAQWNKALELFEAEILFHIQADADCASLELLFERIYYLFSKYNLGVYEPFIDYTDIQYDQTKLKQIEPGVFEVPFTDCTCWCIRADVARQFLPVDISTNHYGWGVPRVIAALAHLSDALCVRDYAVKIDHPRGRGYSTAAAVEQMKAYLTSFDGPMRQVLATQERIRERLRPVPASRFLIITAASEEYAGALLAFLGSLELNWPRHPPLLVYDIGLGESTLRFLKERGVPVKKVPEFCHHWREHYTWKLWCLVDAPAENILYIDAGCVVLDSLDEIFDEAVTRGYFFSTNHELLDWEASAEACLGCGVSPEFRLGKPTLPGTLIAFSRTSKMGEIVAEALEVALVEKNIAATNVSHRQDQAIMSLLVYKHLGRVVYADEGIYLGSLSPEQVPGQKIWVHRRKMLAADVRHLAAHVGRFGKPYKPSPPYSMERAIGLAHLYRVHWCYGQSELNKARNHFESAFRVDPTLKNEVLLLARLLIRYEQRLRRFKKTESVDDEFVLWAFKVLKSIHGLRYAVRLRRLYNRERSHS